MLRVPYPCPAFDETGSPSEKMIFPWKEFLTDIKSLPLAFFIKSFMLRFSVGRVDVAFKALSKALERMDANTISSVLNS